MECDERERVPKRPARGAARGSSSSSNNNIYSDEIELIDLKHWRSVLLQPVHSSVAVYDMHESEDKERLAAALWTDSFTDSLHFLREMNRPLLDVLRAQIANMSDQTDLFVANKERLLDGILMDIVRAQNQRKMPILTAAVGILAHVHHVPREFHNTLMLYHKGALPSPAWVHDILQRARTLRPPPTEVSLSRIRVAAFDNLSMNVDYSSYVREGEGGYKLEMTNK
jgi:hypothetical protein